MRQLCVAAVLLAAAAHSASAAPKPPPSSSDAQQSAGSKLGLRLRQGVSCWIAEQVQPPFRRCRHVTGPTTDSCRAANVSESDACRLCARGWGAWASEAECLAPAGPQFKPAEDDATPADPAAYPAPFVMAMAACSSGNAPASGKVDACPHHWPGLLR
jgi:hypothetical protein